MLIVRKLTGLALVSDMGRVGFASQGVPRGGALVRSFLSAANVAVGNAKGAAAIELFGRITLAAESDVVVATELGDVRTVLAGEELTIEARADRRVRYLAVAGGIEAPVVLGSRSALGDRVGIGVGDGLGVGDGDGDGLGLGDGDGLWDGDGIAIVAGPDADNFDPGTLDELTRRAWRISARSDRVGTRLEGGLIARVGSDALPSAPMVVGAVQIPAGGEPIALGPDGPTTGGYPLLAVIVDLDRFHALPLGAKIQFTCAKSSR